MNIQQFWSDILAQRAGEIRKYFHADAYVNWHCSNEHFTLEEFIRANCEYPGDWAGKIEKNIIADNMIITSIQVYPKDCSASFHVTSFIELKDDKIVAMDEYWADDSEAPKWRKEMGIGVPIRNKIELRSRTEAHVKEYYYRVQDAEIQKMIPLKAQSLEEALDDYYCSISPDSKSYGRTIYVNDIYVGDVWCYCIDLSETPNAMLSYCLFAKQYWGRKIATAAVKLFIELIRKELGITKIGAFTYTDNAASIAVLEKCGFRLAEVFVEDGVSSSYFELDTPMLSADESIALSVRKVNDNGA